MTSAIEAVNAYKGLMNKVGGAEPRDSDSHLGQFKKLIEGSSPRDSGISSLASGMVSTTIESLKHAEVQAEHAAKGIGDPLEVAKAMTAATNNAEGVVNSLSKALEAYNKIASLPV